ncbi:MAG TPA: MerR family transcriptional regulator [Acidimicrobiales bacterium]|nr:MerR family transcriptional regulator [Acidimicrobiales bacterium]
MSGRSYLSIGDVLTLLRQEFPDVTISKIRFLESQGLVNPERTPSGYRKFYEQDVERLRWVLRQQREHFLPLKVIKDRLGDESNGSETPAQVEAGRPGPLQSDRRSSDPPRTADPVLVGHGAIAAPPPRIAAGSRPASPEPAPIGGGQPGRLATEVSGSTPSRVPTGGGPAALYDQEDPGVLTRRATPIDPTAPRSSDRTPTAPRGAAAVPVSGALPTTADPPRPSAPTAAAPMPAVVSPASPPPTPPAEPPVMKAAAAPGNQSPPPRPASPASRPGAKPAIDPTDPNATAAPNAPDPSGSAAGKTKSKAAGPAVSELAGLNGASLTLEELSAASGLDILVIEELCGYGLLSPTRVGGGEYYDEEALAVANLVAGFARFGIEPRHLRLYKNAAEREAGFVEQIVLPLVRQRNPEARAKANETADELIRLGQGLRSSLLRKALHDLLGK